MATLTSDTLHYEYVDTSFLTSSQWKEMREEWAYLLDHAPDSEVKDMARSSLSGYRLDRYLRGLAKSKSNGGKGRGGRGDREGEGEWFYRYGS